MSDRRRRARSVGIALLCCVVLCAPPSAFADEKPIPANPRPTVPTRPYRDPYGGVDVGTVRTVAQAQGSASDHDTLSIGPAGDVILTNDDVWVLDRGTRKFQPKLRSDEPDGLGLPKGIAETPDGRRYVSDSSGVYQLLPDGKQARIAGGGRVKIPKVGRIDPQLSATRVALLPIGMTTSSNGTLYIVGFTGIYRLTNHGTLDTIVTFADGMTETQSVAVDAHERLYYVADPNDDCVTRVDHGNESCVAGGGDVTRVRGNGDGDAATDAILNLVWSVALDPKGNLYIATDDGIRRVGTDGTINTVLPESNFDADAMATDRFGNLYYQEASDKHRTIKVLVHASDIDTSGFPWWLVWTAAGVVVVAAGIAFYLRKRRATAT